MPHTEFCLNKECEYRLYRGYMGKMTRIYIRQGTDQEYKTDSWKWKRKKQIFKSIGWLCPGCKSFRLDKEYSKNIFGIPDHRSQAGELTTLPTSVSNLPEEKKRLREDEIEKQQADVRVGKLTIFKDMNAFERRAARKRLTREAAPLIAKSKSLAFRKKINRHRKKAV
jgi:hypothetical protein